MNDMAISHHGCVLLVVTALSAIALCGFFITKRRDLVAITHLCLW